MTDRNAIHLLTVLTVLGAGLRLFNLGGQCLWMDELASLSNSASFGTGGLPGLAQVDHVAPLHYVILFWVIDLFGTSAEWLRLPSVVAGILTIPAVFLLAKRLTGSQDVSIASAALVAISPFAVWYSQEARMYALLLLVAALYVLLSWPITKRMPTVGECFLLVVGAACGLYVHHYMALLIAAFGLFLVLRGGLFQARFWGWVVTQVIALVLFVPWLLLTMDKLDAQSGFPKPMPWLWLPYTLYVFVAGFSLGPSISELRQSSVLSTLLTHAWWVAAVGISVSVVAAAGLRHLWRNNRDVAVWCVVWTAVPMLLAMAVTLLTNVSYNARYAIVSYPAVMLTLGAGVAASRRSIVAALGTLLLCICMCWSLAQWYAKPGYAKEDVRSLVTLLRSEVRGDDLIVVANGRIIPALDYYGFRLPDDSLSVTGDPGSSTSSLGTVLRELTGLRDDSGRRIWLIEYRRWESDPERTLKDALSDIAEIEQTYEWVGVSLIRYRLRGDGEKILGWGQLPAPLGSGTPELVTAVPGWSGDLSWLPPDLSLRSYHARWVHRYRVSPS